MPDDNQSKAAKSPDDEEQRIMEILKGGFETKRILQLRVRETDTDAGPKAGAEASARPEVS
jgi:hypothetical protein